MAHEHNYQCVTQDYARLVRSHSHNFVAFFAQAVIRIWEYLRQKLAHYRARKSHASADKNGKTTMREETPLAGVVITYARSGHYYAASGIKSSPFNHHNFIARRARCVRIQGVARVTCRLAL